MKFIGITPITLAFVCTLTVANAQKNLMPGYYVKPSGDTVRGFIHYRLEELNNSNFFFTPTMEDYSTQFSPLSALSYSFQNTEFYDQVALQDRQGTVTHVFMRVILRGKLSLMKYHNEYYCVPSEGDAFKISVGVTADSRFADPETRSTLSPDAYKKDYSGLAHLKLITLDCPDMRDMLDKAYHDGDFPDFSTLFEHYASCTHTSLFHGGKVKGKKASVTYGLLASYYSVTGTFSSIKAGDLDPYSSFGLGGFVTVGLPAINKNLRFGVELSYARFSGEKSYVVSGPFGNHNTGNISVTCSFLRAPLLVRYSFKPMYIEGGIYTAFVISQDIQWKKITNGDPTVNAQAGLLGGAGFEFFPVRIGVRYNQSGNKDAAFKSFEFVAAIQFNR